MSRGPAVLGSQQTDRLLGFPVLLHRSRLSEILPVGLQGTGRDSHRAHGAACASCSVGLQRRRMARDAPSLINGSGVGSGCVGGRVAFKKLGLGISVFFLTG